MGFVVKDLMIKSLRGDGEELGVVHRCRGCSLVHCSLPSCGHHSCVVTPITGRLNEVLEPEDLEILKEQLTEALQEVELRQEVVKQQLQPQTIEDVDALETRLNEALAELRTVRERLEREDTQSEQTAS